MASVAAQHALSFNSPSGDTLLFSNDSPLILLAGMNVLENAEIAEEVAVKIKDAACQREIPFVFKASFDKANRSSLVSYRGPGLEKGLRILADLKSRYKVPIITDIHEPHQASIVADVADIIQIPAFLARQTDLISAAAKTGRILNIKKPQFLAPKEMQHIIEKCVASGNKQILLCERGSQFGYNNLVVDTLGIDLMRRMAPVIMDVTHALQRPGGLATGADGRRSQIMALTKATVSLGIAGLFLETHPNPDEARCDGPCALPLDRIGDYLDQVLAIDRLVKKLPDLDID